MDTRLLATSGAFGAVDADLPRRDMGQRGVDRAPQGSGIGKPVCEAATGGGRGR